MNSIESVTVAPARVFKALSSDDLRRCAPSIFAEHARPGVSSRYTFVSTQQVRRFAALRLSFQDQSDNYRREQVNENNGKIKSGQFHSQRSNLVKQGYNFFSEREMNRVVSGTRPAGKNEGKTGHIAPEVPIALILPENWGNPGFYQGGCSPAEAVWEN